MDTASKGQPLEQVGLEEWPRCECGQPRRMERASEERGSLSKGLEVELSQDGKGTGSKAEWQEA